MKVYLKPTGLMSRAMYRVAHALTTYAPKEVDVVRRPEQADLRIMHTIGPDMFDFVEQQGPSFRFAVIQYCYKSAGGNEGMWQELWSKSHLVWSYYDLPLDAKRFYQAPLGVDADIFIHRSGERTIGAMTSGYVTGPGCEAIEEVALAANKVGMPVTHLGPIPVYGHNTTQMMNIPQGWSSMQDVSDEVLSRAYGQTKWVSGLRYVEGFEVPAAEGLLCGARPVCFDRPEMHRWYDGHAIFVPELTGQDLVGALAEVFSREPEEVSKEERERARSTFDWETISRGFWNRLLENAA